MMCLRFTYILCLLTCFVLQATVCSAEIKKPTGDHSQIFVAALKNYRKQFTSDGRLPSEKDYAQNQTKQPAVLPKPAKPAVNTNQLKLQDLITSVIKHNQELHKRAAEWDIRKIEVEKNQAIFEPDFVSSLKQERNSQKNTIEESLSRQLASTYSERNLDFNTSLEGLLKSGGEFNLGYNLRHLSNSVTRSLVNEDEYQMYLGVSLTQPLLKNFGVDTTMAAIRSSKIDSRVSFQDYRQEMMLIVHKTINAYWNYHFAEQRAELRKKSINIAEQVLEDNRQRLRIGKMSDTDVYEASAALSSRKVLLKKAEQEHVSAANQLRNLLTVKADDTPLGVTTVNIQESSPPILAKEHRIQSAFKFKPNYLSTQEKLKQADIRIAYAKNQQYPELDLLASYGLNGLGFKSSESWRQLRGADHQSWGIGIEFRKPIFGGKASKSDYRKAELEKKFQIYELKKLEVETVNEIDTAMHKLNSTREQVAEAAQIVEIQKKLLDIEQQRLNAGKSNTRTLLEREDQYREARETLLKHRVDHLLARAGLELADGSILKSHGVEIMEGQ